jgi:hypothetical protein
LIDLGQSPPSSFEPSTNTGEPNHEEPVMTSFTFSLEQLKAAPPEVRRWVEHEIGAALGALSRFDHDPSQALARFFATARRVNITPTVYLYRFRAECGDSRVALQSGGGPALRHAAQCVARRVEAFIDRRKDLLLQRVVDGRVVEGHAISGPNTSGLDPPRRSSIVWNSAPTCDFSTR